MIKLVPVKDENQAFLLSLFMEIKEAELQFLHLSNDQRTSLLTHQFNIQHHAYTSQFPLHDHYIITSHTQKVGQVRIFNVKNIIQLVDISIHKQFQSQGIATSIIRQLQHDAEVQSKSILLHVFNTNVSARRLYEWLGFQKVKDKEPYIAMSWQSIPT